MTTNDVRGSHIDLFDRCPYAFYTTVIAKRTPDIKVPRWAMIGWCAHDALRVAAANDASAKDELRRALASYKEICRREWASEWPDIPIDDYDIPVPNGETSTRGMRMMGNFELFRKKILTGTTDIQVERPFRICLDENGTVGYKGRIDYTAWVNSELVVIDYKSGRPEWEHKEVPVQLLRYAIAISVLESVPIATIRTIVLNLESGRAFERRWTAKEANIMVASMLGKIDVMQSVDRGNAAGRVGGHCRAICSYRPSCVYYNGKL